MNLQKIESLLCFGKSNGNEHKHIALFFNFVSENTENMKKNQKYLMGNLKNYV